MIDVVWGSMVVACSMVTEIGLTGLRNSVIVLIQPIHPSAEHECDGYWLGWASWKLHDDDRLDDPN